MVDEGNLARQAAGRRRLQRRIIGEMDDWRGNARRGRRAAVAERGDLQRLRLAAHHFGGFQPAFPYRHRERLGPDVDKARRLHRLERPVATALFGWRCRHALANRGRQVLQHRIGCRGGQRAIPDGSGLGHPIGRGKRRRGSGEQQGNGGGDGEGAMHRIPHGSVASGIRCCGRRASGRFFAAARPV